MTLDNESDCIEQSNAATKSWWPWLVFVVAMLLLNLLVLPVCQHFATRNSPLLRDIATAIGLGSFSGQACLMGVLGGLYGKSWLRGFLLATALGIAGVTMLMLGKTFHDYYYYSSYLSLDALKQFLFTWLLTPMLILSMSAATLVFRTAYGWRLTRSEDDNTRTTAIGIEDLFIGTAISAACLVLVRSVQELQQEQWFPFWALIGSLYGIMAITSLIAVVPSVWIAFRVKRRTRRLALFTVFAIVSTGIVIVAVTVTNRVLSSGPIPSYLFFTVVWMLASSLTFVIGLSTLRASGFSLTKKQANGASGHAAVESSSPSGLVKQHRRLAVAIFTTALAINFGIAAYVYRRDTRGQEYQTLNEQLAERDGGLEFNGKQQVIGVVLGEGATVTDLTEVLEFQELRNLSLADSQIVDEDLKLLRSLPQIRNLDLSGTQVTDAGLKSLDDLSPLHKLSLARTNITVNGVIYLIEHKGVMSLDLGGLGLDDADMKRLAGIPEVLIGGDPIRNMHPVQSISLAGNPITADGLIPLLRRHIHIDELDLTDCKIDETGLKSLSKRTFKKLVLDGTLISDKAFGQLLQGMKVERLSFDRTQITDAILPSLATATSVTGLAFNETQITEAGLAQCRIAFLASLSLNSKQFSGTCFATWKPGGLQRLDMSYSGVTDQSMLDIVQVPTLWQLDLSHTGISDAALPSLANCAAFTIDLSHTNITANGLAGSGLTDKHIYLAVGQFTVAEMKRIRKTIRVAEGIVLQH